MYKTFDGINIGFEMMSKNKRYRQPGRFQREQNRTSRNKKIQSLKLKHPMNL